MNKKLKKTIFWIVIILIISGVAFCIISVIQARIYFQDNFIGEETDPTEYQSLRAEWGDYYLIKHFPEAIPEDSNLVKFFFVPRVFQGATLVQLRLKLSSEEIDILLDEFSVIARWRYQGGDRSSIDYDFDGTSNGVPTTCFFTSDSENLTFPLSYTLFVIDSKPLGGTNFPWNHGYSFGVAIDPSGNEIVYWAEEW